MRSVTRREFFNHVYTKDFWSGIFGLYYGFDEEYNKTEKLSCEDVGMMLGMKAKRNLKLHKNIDRKEG